MIGFIEPLYNALPENETVKIALLLAMLLFSLALIIFIFILLSRVYQTYRDYRRAWLTKKAEAFITGVLFNDVLNDEMQIRHYRKKYLYNKFSKQIFIEVLLSIYKNLSGELLTLLHGIYVKMELDKFSLKKLNSFHWFVQTKGITELSGLGAKEHVRYIFTFINSKNATLRSEAHIAIVKLSNYPPMQFFENLDVPLTQWEQLKLTDALERLGSRNLPQFGRWLSKRNHSLTAFFVKMIGHFGQSDASEAVVGLLDHPSAEVRKECLVTLRKLSILDIHERLITMYQTESVELREEILKTLFHISTYDQVGFFLEQLHDENYSIRLEAARSILNLGDEGKRLLTSLLSDADEKITCIARHMLDNRISQI